MNSKSKCALSQKRPSALTLRAPLTRISVVEIILNIAGDVVTLFVLNPVCVRLFVVADENSKQNNHRNLPDEADCRQADPNVGGSLAAEKIPHGARSVLWARCSARSSLWCGTLTRIRKYRRSGGGGGVCSDSPLTRWGRTRTCPHTNHTFPALRHGSSGTPAGRIPNKKRGKHSTIFEGLQWELMLKQKKRNSSCAVFSDHTTL